MTGRIVRRRTSLHGQMHRFWQTSVRPQNFAMPGAPWRLFSEKKKKNFPPLRGALGWPCLTLARVLFPGQTRRRVNKRAAAPPPLWGSRFSLSHERKNNGGAPLFFAPCVTSRPLTAVEPTTARTKGLLQDSQHRSLCYPTSYFDYFDPFVRGNRCDFRGRRKRKRCGVNEGAREKEIELLKQ